MAIVQDHVNVQARLATALAPAASFGLQCFLVDNDDIPADVRYRYVTPDGYDDDLTAAGVPYLYSQVYFSQELTPDKLMLARWVKADVAPKFVCGPAYEKDYEVYKAITDGDFTVKDSEANETDVTGVDFSAITALDQILTVLNAELAALVAPDVVGLDSAEFSFDALDRLVLIMPTGGSTEPTIDIIPVDPAVGTDLAEGVFDASNGSSPAGLDAETNVESLQAVSEIDDSYYNVHERGSSIAEQVALATWIESQKKLADIVVVDPNAKDPGATSDAGYQLKALGTKRTMGIYTEHSDQYPDAADAGAVLPAKEGAKDFDYVPLALVTDSGLTKPLTTGERIALADKGYTWIETVGATYLYDGITFGGEEKRIMLGRDWFVTRIAERIFTIQLQTDLMAFDNETLAQVEEAIWEYANEAIERRILVNTPERPFTVNIPDADEISAAERASKKLTVHNAFHGWINSSINDYEIFGTWQL